MMALVASATKVIPALNTIKPLYIMNDVFATTFGTSAFTTSAATGRTSRSIIDDQLDSMGVRECGFERNPILASVPQCFDVVDQTPCDHENMGLIIGSQHYASALSDGSLYRLPDPWH
tara:strand:- start:83 stop:436 length:354 start_codon:yes stop_codon:yes gene_type:complete